jgi:CBS domain-containing protein
MGSGDDAAGEVAGFLRGTPPFGGLPAPLLAQAARAAEPFSAAAGARLASAGGEPFRHLHVIRRGAVRIERDGRSLQVLGAGECFGYTSLLTGKAALDVVVEEDLLAVRIPAAVFRALLADAAFAAHFAEGLGERLRSSLERPPAAPLQADLSRSVRQMVRRPAVWVTPDATAAEAARVMRRERISSVLVRSDPPGILTDRDLRDRVLAEDRSATVPVAEVMTRPLRVAAATTPVHEAWSALLDGDVHHLPLVEGDEVVGVITATDLLRLTPQGPVAALRRVERLASRAELPGHGARVTDMASALLAGGLEPLLIAGFVARLDDALARRILQWAEAELGPPPVPYAWVVCGSEGRREQLLLTDQDNALVYADEGAEHRGWFERLAARADEDLRAAGFPPCPGGYMARAWHGTLSEWARRFEGWMDVPSGEAILLASVFFDFRAVHGALDLSRLDAVLRLAPERRPFLRELASDALRFRPPAPLLLRLRGRSAVADLKAHGISGVVALARCYGLQARCRGRGSVERLEAAAAAGLLDEGTQALVGDAYRFLLALRLRLQLRALGEGRPPSSRVPFAALSAVERGRLVDCLKAIAGWQRAAADHFHAGDLS